MMLGPFLQVSFELGWLRSFFVSWILRWFSLLSRVQLFATPWTVACQPPLFMGFFQARILEWVAISFSRQSSPPRDENWVSFIAGRFFTNWATREALSTEGMTSNTRRRNHKFGMIRVAIGSLDTGQMLKDARRCNSHTLGWNGTLNLHNMGPWVWCRRQSSLQVALHSGMCLK